MQIVNWLVALIKRIMVTREVMHDHRDPDLKINVEAMDPPKHIDPVKKVSASEYFDKHVTLSTELSPEFKVNDGEAWSQADTLDQVKRREAVTEDILNFKGINPAPTSEQAALAMGKYYAESSDESADVVQIHIPTPQLTTDDSLADLVQAEMVAMEDRTTSADEVITQEALTESTTIPMSDQPSPSLDREVATSFEDASETIQYCMDHLISQKGLDDPDIGISLNVLSEFSMTNFHDAMSAIQRNHPECSVTPIDTLSKDDSIADSVDAGYRLVYKDTPMQVLFSVFSKSMIVEIDTASADSVLPVISKEEHIQGTVNSIIECVVLITGSQNDTPDERIASTMINTITGDVDFPGVIAKLKETKPEFTLRRIGRLRKDDIIICDASAGYTIKVHGMLLRLLFSKETNTLWLSLV